MTIAVLWTRYRNQRINIDLMIDIRNDFRVYRDVYQISADLRSLILWKIVILWHEC